MSNNGSSFINGFNFNDEFNECKEERNNDRRRKGDCGHRECERFEDNRFEALRDIEFDIKIVRCGIEDVKAAICKIRNGCICDGITLAKMGACNMEMGINNLIRRFESGCFEAGCKSQRLIDEAICSLKEAICLIFEGIEALEAGCFKEGIAKLERALCNAEEGLCDLIKALQRFC